MYRRSILLSATIAALLLSITGCGGGGGSSTPTIPNTTTGLIHQWSFNGDTNDSIGTLNGTIKGAITYVNSANGLAISGNGASGVTLPDTTDMQLQGPFTVSAWFKVTSYPTYFGMIIFRGDDRIGLDPFFIGVDSSARINFTIQNSSQTNSLYTAAPLNQTIFVTAVNDPVSGKMSLYKNGQLVSETSISILPLITLDASSHPGIGIACNNDYPNSAVNYSLTGVVDDVRVYNRALSASDITALYLQNPQ